MKPTLHTHYDNLKVARDAPLEVIKAAYRSLAQKYHPDRSDGNPEHLRYMQLINHAYSVLSDPEKRRKHDAWILAQEPAAPPPEAQAVVAAPAQAGRRHALWLTAFGVAVGLGLAGLAWRLLPSSPAAASPVQPRASQTPSRAPNGQPWPTQAGYLPGYPIDRLDGQSTVLLDNRHGASPVFAKLFQLDNGLPSAVRYVYVPAAQSFLMEHIASGRYDIRYLTLDTGALTKTSTFDLRRIPQQGNRDVFSSMRIALAPGPQSMPEGSPISHAEF